MGHEPVEMCQDEDPSRLPAPEFPFVERMTISRLQIIRRRQRRLVKGVIRIIQAIKGSDKRRPTMLRLVVESFRILLLNYQMKSPKAMKEGACC